MAVSPSDAIGATPFVIIKRDGLELPADEAQSIVKVTVRDDMDGVDAFQIDFSGQEADRRIFPPPWSSKWLPGRKVSIVMGYQDSPSHAVRPADMIEGVVTGVAASSVDPAIFSVVGRGLIGVLDETPRARAFVNMTDNQIARAIAKEAGSPIDAPHREGTTDVVWEHVLQDNITDLAFLRRRARRAGCLMTTVTGVGGRGRQLYFGPSPDPPSVYNFTYGKDLHHFDPTLNTDKQVGEVVVQGWDPVKGAPARAAVRRGANGFGGKMKELDNKISPAFAGRREILAQASLTAQAATAIATGVMTDIARGMATAEGSCAGLQLLTVGERIEVGGFGNWCDGLWVVSAAAHQIGQDGYRTMFRCYRDPY